MTTVALAPIFTVPPGGEGGSLTGPPFDLVRIGETGEGPLSLPLLSVT